MILNNDQVAALFVLVSGSLRRDERRRLFRVGGHLFADSELAVMAAVARSLDAAAMARYSGESIRQEAARRGVTTYRVRRERYGRLGFTPTEAGGHGGGVGRPERLEVGGPNGPLPDGLRLRGPADRARAYELLKDINDLGSGRLSLPAFDQRWAGRRFGGQRLPSAAEVLGAMNVGDFDPRHLGTP